MTSASAPGRVELLGNHTDYNEGVVLAGAIDRGVTLTGEQMEGDNVHLHSLTSGDATCWQIFASAAAGCGGMGQLFSRSRA